MATNKRSQGGRRYVTRWMSEELKIVASAANEAEADLICGRLLEDGIHAIARRTLGAAQWGISGTRSVLVSPADFDRAQELLKSEEGSFSDEELTRLSEEAGREAEESGRDSGGSGEDSGS
jgi:transcriptional/translational regulatory protein YebC/TACO1